MSRKATTSPIAPQKAAPQKAAAHKQAPAKTAAPSKAVAKKEAPVAKARAAAPVAKVAKTVAAKTPAKAVAAKAPAPKAAAVKAPVKAVVTKAAVTKAPVTKAPAHKALPAKAPPAKAPAVKAKAGKERAVFFASQKKLLLDERAGYLNQAEALKAQADSLALEHEPGDVQFDEEGGEGGTANVDREMDLHLSAQARAIAAEIDRALDKIDDGTYGLCESCSEPIPDARLEALPHAALCVNCKSGGLSSRR
jgi:RNA polymerase-binding transcription factor DksA